MIYLPQIILLIVFSFVSSNDYEKAFDLLEKIPSKRMTAELYFYKAACYYNFIDKDNALKCLAKFDDFFNKTERHEALAFLMREDMKTWKKDSLGEAAKLARTAGRRLNLHKANGDTQVAQKRIVDILNKMIKEQEDALEKARADALAKEKGGKGSGKGQPLPDSQVANDAGPGKIEEKKLREYAQVWGTLPEKERAAAMMELSKNLPPRYREIIEAYAKTLAKGQKKQ